MSYTPDQLQAIADKLEAPLLLVEYLHDEYVDEHRDSFAGEEGDCFELYLAERISEAAFLHYLYVQGDVDSADDQSATVYAEICELLGQETLLLQD